MTSEQKKYLELYVQQVKLRKEARKLWKKFTANEMEEILMEIDKLGLTDEKTNN